MNTQPKPTVTVIIGGKPVNPPCFTVPNAPIELMKKYASSKPLRRPEPRNQNESHS